jgi:hypothetical protein
MQHFKGNKFSEINGYCQNHSVLAQNLKSLLGVFDLGYINKLFSKSKLRGVDAKDIFPVLFLIRFLDFNNVSQFMGSGLACRQAGSPRNYPAKKTSFTISLKTHGSIGAGSFCCSANRP